MTWEELREYCLSLPGATETFPFEPTVSVFKAANGKMFGVTTEKAEPIDISVKCEPAIGEALRAQYESIAPGYHLNKRHWITITLNGDVPDERVRELVLDSYELVAPKAPKRVWMKPDERARPAGGAGGGPRSVRGTVRHSRSSPAEGGALRRGGASRRETRTNCAQSATPPSVSAQLPTRPLNGATMKQLIEPAAGTNSRRLIGSQRRARSSSGSGPPRYLGSGASTSMNSMLGQAYRPRLSG